MRQALVASAKFSHQQKLKDVTKDLSRCSQLRY